MSRLLLLILALLAPAPLTATWQGHSALHVTWTAPGWHCVKLDNTWLDNGCGVGSKDFTLPTGGVDSAYKPDPGDVLRLYDYGGTVVASAVVPPQEWRVVLLPVMR